MGTRKTKMSDNANSSENVEEKSRKQVIFGTVISYLSILLSILSGLFFTSWVITIIGKSDYGIFSLATSLINLFLIDFGLGTTINRYLSRYRARNDVERENGFLTLVYKLFFIVTIILSAFFTVYYFFLPQIYTGLTAEEVEKLKTSYIIIVSFNVITFPCTGFKGVLSSYEEFTALSLCDIIQKVFYIVLVVCALYSKVGIYGVIAAQGISTTILYGVKYILIKKRTPVSFGIFKKSNINQSEKTEIIKFAAWVCLSSILSRLIINIEPSFLGRYSNSTQIAIFGVSSTLESYIYTFGSVIGGFFLPKVSRINAADDGGKSSIVKLESLAMKVGKIELIFVGLLMCGFIVCGQSFILVWLKGDKTYLGSYVGTIAMSLCHLILIPELILDSALTEEGFVKHQTIVLAIMAVISLSLSIPFIEWWGAMGASISIGISMLTQALLNNFFYKRDLHINIASFLRHLFVRPLTAMIISIGCVYPIAFFWKTTDFKNFIVCFVVIIVIYPLAMWFIGLSKNERQYCRSLASELAKKRKNKA